MKMDNKTTLALIELATVALLVFKDIAIKHLELQASNNLEG